ncbi:MAG: hypothetical protein NTW33_10050 [Methanoregula sp.]|nr:hypothetical protein [Methanoregula sp.]
MATVQGMSGIDVKAVVVELVKELPLWIDKVYQFDPRTMGIRLNGEKHAKHLLLIEAGRRAKTPRSLRCCCANISPAARCLQSGSTGWSGS